MKAPCYKCEDRKFRCHSTCEKYLEYAESRRIECEKRIEQNAVRQSHNQRVRAEIQKKTGRRY